MESSKYDETTRNITEMQSLLSGVLKEPGQPLVKNYPEYGSAIEAVLDYKMRPWSQKERATLIQAVETLSFPVNGALDDKKTSWSESSLRSAGVQQFKESIANAVLSLRKEKGENIAANSGDIRQVQNVAYKAGIDTLTKGLDDLLNKLDVSPDQITESPSRRSVLYGQVKAFVAGGAIAGSLAAGATGAALHQHKPSDDRMLTDKVTEIVNQPAQTDEQRIQKLREALNKTQQSR